MNTEELQQLKELLRKTMSSGKCTQQSDLNVLRNARDLISLFISRYSSYESSTEE